jgi:hypothetical protein
MVHGVDIDVPVNLNTAVRVLGAVRWPRRLKPRYLVYQEKVVGATNKEQIIYAEVFWRKSRAKRAQVERNVGIPSLGNRTFGSKRWAVLVTLPVVDGTGKVEA